MIEHFGLLGRVLLLATVSFSDLTRKPYLSYRAPFHSTLIRKRMALETFPRSC